MNENKTINQQLNHFDQLGRYIFEDYDHQRPFSSFLSGIAGLHGIPMWVFYVNRGQAVCSFGVENKDHPIVEFQAANKAYQSTALAGFRTFFNGERGGVRWQREVFSPWDADDVKRTMYIGMGEVEIQEVNQGLGYQVNVLYAMLPGLPFAALVRQVRIRNLGETPLNLEVLDGLPRLIPYGADNGVLKHISRTIEAWMQVINLENRLPFYRLKATPGDTAEVHAIEAGNYALAFGEDGLLPAVADPVVVFGLDTGHAKAYQFHNQGMQSLFESPQILEGRSLCAFFGTTLQLDPGAETAITSLYGYSHSLSNIQSWVETLRSPGYIDQKLQEARHLTEDLTAVIRTESVSSYFDGYCAQTFLDNVLRGGFPLIMNNRYFTHVYARKHGDIERDYNYFVIPPEFYSEGNGNYRDVNQNRRNDIFFAPQVGEFNIRMFMSLIQADGYNPLVINGLTFSVSDEALDDLLPLAQEPAALKAVLLRKFTLGKLYAAVLQARTSIPAEEFLEKVMSQAKPQIEAEHGEGYWVDHWTYNMDLIDAYLAVYPEEKTTLLFDSEPLPFYECSTVVQPRAVRYVLSDGKPRQLNALLEDHEKEALILSRQADQSWVRDQYGHGEMFCLPLISKLALLALIKFATRDPEGMGIQMEAGKPGWYDALNGLPGLFGSSMPETYELLRLVNFLTEVFDQTAQGIPLPVEAQGLLDVIGSTSSQELDDFASWNAFTDVLEAYRQSTRLGFAGDLINVHLADVLRIMQASLHKGIEKAHVFGNPVPPTYFRFEVTAYELIGTEDSNGNPHIKVNQFKPVPVPPFLEGPARLMQLLSKQQARELDVSIRQSDLFDPKLGMYKVNAPLDSQSHAIGRARAFTPGWLENESIWLHMAFKYLLALLKAGLYDEFFAALKAHLPAFMDPSTYGRSPLENSSFIVSSAHPDASLHGNGFVARLSGSTAEFLSMWVMMTVGQQPFKIEQGQVVLIFQPILPGWLFSESGHFTFRFLGTCEVRVHNPACVNTFGEGSEIQRIELHAHDKTISIDGPMIPAPYAEQVRQGAFDSIDLFY